jgi:hypothetical protein
MCVEGLSFSPSVATLSLPLPTFSPWSHAAPLEHKPRRNEKEPPAPQLSWRRPRNISTARSIAKYSLTMSGAPAAVPCAPADWLKRRLLFSFFAKESPKNRKKGGPARFGKSHISKTESRMCFSLTVCMCEICRKEAAFDSKKERISRPISYVLVQVARVYKGRRESLVSRRTDPDWRWVRASNP